MQQFADAQIMLQPSMWTENARRHEIMKAILLNSADKYNGVHGSTRTILDGFQGGQDWSLSEAALDDTKALDDKMGAGHLNVKSALTNFQAGEHEPGIVPPIGWNLGLLGSSGSFDEYTFDRTLQAEEWVAITLAWDRRVAITGVDDDYDSTDGFFNKPIDMELNNLNIYLMPADSDDINTAVATSVAEADSVEHIFVQIFDPGEYKIRVTNSGNGGSISDDQEYALAWWAGETEAPLEGDFDEDGDVDGADLNEWRNDFGQTAGSDADGDGDSDGADFLAWQRNLGATSITPTSVPVPEPTAWLLGVVGLPLLMRQIPRRTIR